MRGHITQPCSCEGRDPSQICDGSIQNISRFPSALRNPALWGHNYRRLDRNPIPVKIHWIHSQSKLYLDHSGSRGKSRGAKVHSNTDCNRHGAQKLQLCAFSGSTIWRWKFTRLATMTSLQLSMAIALKSRTRLAGIVATRRQRLPFLNQIPTS